MVNAEVFVPCDALVGEGPVVEEAAGRLVFVDIPQGRLLQADLREAGPATEICAFGPDGVLFVTSALEGVDAAREPLAGSVLRRGDRSPRPAGEYIRGLI